jgi:hypothetical protein
VSVIGSDAATLAQAEIATLIIDDVLAAFSVSGTPAHVAATVQQRFGDVIDRISRYTPHTTDRADIAAVTAALRADQAG